MARRFRRAGDVEAALALVAESEGLQRTLELAGSYSEAARASLRHMRGSGPGRDAGQQGQVGGDYIDVQTSIISYVSLSRNLIEIISGFSHLLHKYGGTV